MDFLYKRSVPAWIVAIFLMLSAIGMISIAHLVQRKAQGWPSPLRLNDIAWAIGSIPNLLPALFRDEDAVTSTPPTRLLAGFYRAPESAPDNGFLLITHYDEAAARRLIRILRLSDGAFIHTYQLTRNVGWWQPEELISARLMPDGGIVYQDRAGLHRVDACGTKRLWTLPQRVHHSTEIDRDGAIWVPGALWLDPKKRSGGRVETVLKIAPHTGKVISEDSIADIFERSNLSWIVRSRPFLFDPHHINDIEPVNQDGPHWRRGDVFLSLRNLSMILLYRPSVGKIVWWQIGPWLGQHDVQIIDDHRIAIFDNRSASIEDGFEVLGNSRELVLDFRDKSVSSPYEAAFRKHQVKSLMQGRGLILDNGDVFVEDTMMGRLLRMDAKGNLKWRYVAARGDGNRYWLGWTRYLDGQRDAPAVKKAVEAKC